MPSRVYPFVQVEIPFELGVPDGRWMVRDHVSLQVERVIVLCTARPGRLARRRQASSSSSNESRTAHAAASTVPLTCATIVAAEALEGEQEAADWLSRLDEEREIASAFGALNKLLAAHRIAAADPHVHEVAPTQALNALAGFGSGEQVAQGRWQQARNLPLTQPKRWRRGRRAAILRSQERLARLLSRPQDALLCEELALRARLDLDGGRLLHAAGELERALQAALVELDGEPGVDLGARLAELRDLLPSVQETLAKLPQRTGGGAFGAADEARDSEAATESLEHALGRLEAALRARAVALAWS